MSDWEDVTPSKQKASDSDWEEVGASSPAPQQKKSYLDEAPSDREKWIRSYGKAAKAVLPENLYSKLKNAYLASEAFSGGVGVGGTYGNHEPDRLEKAAAELHPNIHTAGKIVGGIGTGAVVGQLLGLAAPATAMGRVALQTAGGLGQGLAQKPEEDKGRLSNLDPRESAWNLMHYLPGVTSAVTELAVPAMRSAANASKLRSVGINKDFTVGEGANLNPQTGNWEALDTAGVGNALNKMGVGGSRASMAEQVASKSRDAEAQLQKLLGQSKDLHSSSDLIEKLTKARDAFRDPVTGNITNPERYEAITSAIQQHAGKDYSGQGLLQLKRAGDSVSRNTAGNVKPGADPQTQKLIADWARQKVYNYGPEAIDALQKERALAIAGKALSRPETLNRSGVSFRDVLSAAGGSAIGGPLGGLTGFAASQVAKSPAVMSAVSRAIEGGADVAELFKNPVVVQSLFGGINGAKQE